MYTIGQISDISGLPVSTLRYYDRQGLFPDMKRVSGIRQFGDSEIEAIRVIECLKKSGLEIRDIRRFMEWCKAGPSTYEERLELFVKQKKHLEKEIADMKRVLDMLNFKCWYYEQAIRDGGEERIGEMIPDGLPDEIREAYDRTHNELQMTER